MSRGRQYDGAITIFSPEGRIYQVEYALELVKRGSPIVGVRSPEGVVLAAIEPRLSKLSTHGNSKKIFKIDEHVGVAIAGLSPDARVLIRRARITAQSNRLTYSEPVDIEDLTSSVGDLLQTYTQNAGVRPFGVSLIFGGVDNYRVSLIAIDPSGSYRGYKATSVGRNSDAAKEVLEKQYKDELSLEEAIALSIEALEAAVQKEISVENLKIAIIPKERKEFQVISDLEVQKYL